MNKLIIATMLAASSIAAFAMPTKAELKKAQPLVVELMAPAMEKYKSAPYKEKAAAAAKVGDASAEFAKAAETEAVKFLLLKGAVSFYARGEQYDKAAETVTTLQREIKDVPPAVIAEITGKATGSISETNAPALYALYRAAKLQVRANEEAKALSAKLKKMQSDALQRKYAEALAVSGDWKSAYAEFAKVRDAKLQAIVKDESSGSAKSAEAGEFWWSYEPAMEGAEDFFKSHAAAFYRKALDAGEITGLKKNLIEQRIKDVKVEDSPNAKNTKGSIVKSYGSTDIKTGKDSPFEVKGSIAELKFPNGEKIKFVKCPKGKFNMLFHYTGDAQLFPTTMDHEFWISDRVITKAHESGIFPEKSMSVNDNARHDAMLVNDDAVDAVAARLHSDYGKFLPNDFVFRLPSMAEFEYAYHANSKDPNDPYFPVVPNDAMKKKITNSLGPGRGAPNAWGIYDMIRYQKFLDRIDPNDWVINKVPTGNNGVYLHEFKGRKNEHCAPFFWSEKDDAYTVSIYHDNFKDRFAAQRGGRSYHFHLVIGPDLVSEWKAKHGASSVGEASCLPTTKSTASAMVRQDAAPTSSGKAWQETHDGKRAMLTLKNGVKMEFVKCLPGNFKMCYELSDYLTTPTAITRPYWFLKTVVTVRQYSSIVDPRKPVDKIPENAVYSCTYASLSGSDESLLPVLNEEFGGCIPKGYVFRVPTWAEYQYAFHANTKDKNDPFFSIRDKTLFRQAMKKANADIWHGLSEFCNGWGIQELYRHSFVLDKIAEVEGIVMTGDKPEEKRLIGGVRPDSKNDPLYWNDAPSRFVARINCNGDGVLVTSAEKGKAYIHLVVGPDLVNEWRAKHGKK